jgi:hypothetical protein
MDLRHCALALVKAKRPLLNILGKLFFPVCYSGVMNLAEQLLILDDGMELSGLSIVCMS